MLKMLSLAVCLLGAAPGFAETRNLVEHPRPGARPSKLWRISVAALAAGSTADAWSSYGRTEANPLLQGPGGQFSARGIGLKAAIAGGAVATQWFLQRKHPDSAKAFAVTNFGMAAVFSGIAVRNKRLPAYRH